MGLTNLEDSTPLGALTLEALGLALDPLPTIHAAVGHGTGNYSPTPVSVVD